ncbi:MAG: hypothetical protein H7296_08765 [Bacteroidia bacterium]|nr:hypothetical protein [Bacteroidia bacterium]
MLEPAQIDLEKTNKPLLFIGGEKEQIIPADLNKKNAEACMDSLAKFSVFTSRGHFICGQPEWEKVTDYMELELQKLPVQNLNRASYLSAV